MLRKIGCRSKTEGTWFTTRDLYPLFLLDSNDKTPAMLIVDKSVEIITRDHGHDDYCSEFLLSPHKFEHWNIFPANFRCVRIVYVLVFLSILISSKIIGIGGAKICPEVRVRELGGITCELKEDILKTHNDIRQAVAAGLTDSQPTAANMRELYWDDELAAGAQDWANHCTFKHNELVDREIERFQVGQSIAVTKNRGRSPDAKEFPRQIENWFKEHAVYTFGAINEDLESTGHYTQLVWADTYLVGCGYSRFEEASKNVSYRLYVCHYGPSGNVQNEEPYKKGSQKCPKDTVQSRKYNALCALKLPPPNSCNKTLEPSNGNQHHQVLSNARRSEWLEKFLTSNENRNPLSSSVEYQNGNIDPFGSEDDIILIIFKVVIKTRLLNFD